MVGVLLNPFFVREARQHRRNLLLIQFWWVACIAVLTGAFFATTAFHGGRAPGGSVNTMLLCLVHTALCAAAAGYGGDRLFGTEQRSGTLMSVLMLPLPPGKWLAQKLLFPIWGILTTWLVGVPFYVLLMIYRVATPSGVARIIAFPALLAMGVLVILLLLPPDFRERMQRLRASAAVRGKAKDPDLSVRLLLAWSLGYALFAASFRVFMPSGRLPMYGYPVPEWAVWSVMGLGWLGAAWFSALGSLLGTEEAERRGKRARSIAGVALFVIVLGLFWGMMHPYFRIGVLVYVAVVAVVLRKGEQRSEDKGSAAEIEWLQARWDNPMFIRDLRVLTRSNSLRKSCAFGGLLLVVVGIALPCGLTYLITQRNNPPRIIPLPATWFVDAYIGLIVALVFNARAAMFWTRDYTAHTLPLLLMTPMTSREIVKGRTRAGMLGFLASLLPMMAVAVVGSLLVLPRGHWLPLLVVATLLVVAFLQGEVYGCTWRAVRLAPGKILKGDWALIFWWTAYGLLVAAQLGAMVAACVMHFAGGALYLHYPLAVLAVATLGAAWTCWRGWKVRVDQMEAVRRGDLHLPD